MRRLDDFSEWETVGQWANFKFIQLPNAGHNHKLINQAAFRRLAPLQNHPNTSWSRFKWQGTPVSGSFMHYTYVFRWGAAACEICTNCINSILIMHYEKRIFVCFGAGNSFENSISCLSIGCIFFFFWVRLFENEAPRHRSRSAAHLLANSFVSTL